MPRRKSKKKGTRLYVVSDFHAADVAWKKMLNVVKMGLYEADAVFYAGDLTGKSVVPIVERDGAWEAEVNRADTPGAHGAGGPRARAGDNQSRLLSV